MYVCIINNIVDCRDKVNNTIANIEGYRYDKKVENTFVVKKGVKVYGDGNL